MWKARHAVATGQMPIVSELRRELERGFKSMTPGPLFTKTSCRKVSRSLEAARFGFRLLQSLWNLTGSAAAEMPTGRISKRYDDYNIQSRGFETSHEICR